MIAETFESFDSAYLAVLRHVNGQFEHVNAPRGNASRECLNVSFQIVDPVARLPFLPARRVNVVFNFAEALWFLSGRDDLAMIGYYASGMHSYSVDGATIDGAAYGTRLFRPIEQTGLTAFDQALDLIRGDPETKRAVMVIFRPWETADPTHPDVSCTIAFHLLLRDDQLHGVCYMRANDAVQGLVSDVFSFTFIQEFAARQLGVQVGTYGHHVGSMHIGDRNAQRVRRLLDEHPPNEPNPVRFALPAMPTGASWADLEIVLGHEQQLREDRARLRPDDLDALGVDPYWQQIVLLFEVYRQITHETGPVSAATLAALHPAYRWLVVRRWPDRMPPSASAS
jgi:thymidylate synthase